MTGKHSNYVNIALISGSGIIWWIINYAYQPVMIRYLTLWEFGEFASLIGIFNILGIFVLWLTLFLNKEISKNKENKEKNFSLFRGSISLLFFLGIILFALYALFSPFVAWFLHIKIPLVLLAGVSIIISCVWAATDSVLRWLKSFKFIAFTWVFSPLVKFVLWTLFVVYGLHTYWALGWVLLSWVTNFLICYLYVKNTFKWTKFIDTTNELKRDLKLQAKEIANFVLVSFFFAFLMNIDIIFAKNIFSDEMVGIYAWISVLGKFLVFLLLSIETVYYSQIMEHTKEEIPLHFIRNPLMLIVIVSFLALVANYFIGNILLTLLKPELAGNLSLYLLILVYYSFLAVISFLAKVLVWWGKYGVNRILWFFSFLLLIGVYTIGKESLYNYIFVFIAVWIMASVSLLYLMYCSVKEMKKESS